MCANLPDLLKHGYSGVLIQLSVKKKKKYQYFSNILKSSSLVDEPKKDCIVILKWSTVVCNFCYTLFHGGQKCHNV